MSVALEAGSKGQGAIASLPGIDNDEQVACSPGWRNLLVRLSEKLAEVDPDRLIAVESVQRRYGGIRIEVSARTLECCRAVSDAYKASHPMPDEPGPGETSSEYTAYWEGHKAALDAHQSNEAHIALAAKVSSVSAAIAVLVRELEDQSLETCELTGAPGMTMRSGDQLRTLDPVAAPDQFPLEKFDSELVAWQVKHADGDRVKLEAIVSNLSHYATHQQLVMGRLLAALRSERLR